MQNRQTITSQVWFIGAGPGDPELLTIKGHKIISTADLVLYAGSLVPPEVVSCAKKSAKVLDSASMTLNETHSLLRDCVKAGGIAARVHTGDPGLYGTIKEQIELLNADGIPYAVVPGVTASFAAAAAAAVSLTVPEQAQCFTITRMPGRTPVPASQRVGQMAKHGGTVAVYLSATEVDKLYKELVAAELPKTTPIIAAYRVGWPDQKIIRTNIDNLVKDMANAGHSRQVVFLILPGEDTNTNHAAKRSKLYDEHFCHGFRAN